MRIGVLSVQGDFARHIRALKALGVDGVEIRRANDLENIESLIIPGGESTTFDILLKQNGLWWELKRRIVRGLPTWGTCAGAVLLGKGAGRPQPRFECIDVEVLRNAFGRQVDSFVAFLKISFLDEPFPGVFIRAPRFVSIGGGVEILGYWKDEPVVLRQGNVLLTSFHPELTDDLRFHQYFLNKFSDMKISKVAG